MDNETGKLKEPVAELPVNLSVIKRLSKILDVNVRRMLYYDLIYALLAYGIVWGQTAKTLTRQIFNNSKRSVAGCNFYNKLLST
jgi:hypothetical protein